MNVDALINDTEIYTQVINGGSVWGTEIYVFEIIPWSWKGAKTGLRIWLSI
jgi:hypothetical protein